MSFAKVFSAQTNMLRAHIVSIEVDIVEKGLYTFSIIGLPDKAVEEARDRVSAAIKNTGFKSPKSQNHKITISLAPADIKKEGATFDLGIALGYLLATDTIRLNPHKKMFLGELSLDGSVRKINGVLPLVRHALRAGFEEVYVPFENAEEAALVHGITVYGVTHLQSVISHLNTKPNEAKQERQRTILTAQENTLIGSLPENSLLDICDVKGQESAKRGLLIAAAGGHNIAMYGPPGTGKTMLAKAFTSILPPLSFDEMLEVTSIHSVSNALDNKLVTHVPFRAPHHTSSYVSIVGGGAIPKPGEITLAHRGVLFLDEFPEFDRRVIESLREPLEEGHISIARAQGTALFPAQIMLVAAMNPCPCGNYGIVDKQCVCSPLSLDRYRRKISGPIVDRIDLWVEVSQIDYQALSNTTRAGKTSSELRKQVTSAHGHQDKRFANKKANRNSEMSARDVNELVPLDRETRELLNMSAKKLDLSARAYHRIIKLSRTIADLDESRAVGQKHILEALQYRLKSGSI
ncbi:magnesium chelatase [Candidatus Wolfebacteria bacterium]|nr:MAG: magnesium chelatase [Candidatus Wolfebacteria bacterium]